MHPYGYIVERIEQKKHNYRGYGFAETENTAFKTFFDLAQEFDDIEDLYKLCVAIPQAFFSLKAGLYVMDPGSGRLALAASTEDEKLRNPPPEEVRPSEKPYFAADRLVLTIHGKESLMEELPLRAEKNVLGLLEIYPVGGLDPHRVLFFEKYAGRIGFNIHNRFLAEKNAEHLRFIRTLVADIEHNIIAPNMVYKLYLRDLKAKLSNIKEVEGLFSGYCKEEGLGPDSPICVAIEDLKEASRGLQSDFENIESHYRNMSLFLETLLRRSHFDKGRLVLRTKRCNMYRDVIRPQLERYADKLKAMGTEVDTASSGIPEREAAEVVDVGLMAQVYANLFSNAVKYARPVETPSGGKTKFISYGHEILKDYFGPGKDGAKYNVFSTGPHLEPGERKKLYTEGFRGREARRTSGTGHGLSFVKNVIELHGGEVGYEAVEGGNNFYFIIPRG
ncbi:MAG: HAMP domain-containing sensor histidine kinase [Nitrospirota bacterium]|jgi:signal transduction histidine kinase